MPIPRNEIDACSRYFDLPVEILTVKTDFLQKAVREAMAQLPESKKLEKGTRETHQKREAFASMTLDIVRELLANPDDLNQVVEKMLRHVRELSGADTVIILEHDNDTPKTGPDFTILGLNPRRNNKRLEKVDTAPLFTHAAACREMRIIHRNTEDRFGFNAYCRDKRRDTSINCTDCKKDFYPHPAPRRTGTHRRYSQQIRRAGKRHFGGPARGIECPAQAIRILPEQIINVSENK